ncbi:hypothetical protein [Desulfocastanea catecholica]
MNERENLDYEDQKLYDTCQAKWNSDKTIREEFMELADYFHFEKANKKGTVRIQGLRR